MGDDPSGSSRRPAAPSPAEAPTPSGLADGSAPTLSAPLSPDAPRAGAPLATQTPTMDATGDLVAQPGASAGATTLTPTERFDAGGRGLLGGRYQLLGLLGAGGMGNVYRARDVVLDEVVALKMLRRELAGSPGMLERFRREVKLARRITHPNVARTFDIGEHGQDHFLTMEYVQGEPLSALLAREKWLAAARAVAIARAIAAGLGAAHERGVVHRDLKPDNVLLGDEGRVVITDFGIARALAGTEAASQATVGATLGTPAYMAPEQVEGTELDGRADLYALGVMLFQMLTGELPFRGGTPWVLAAARLIGPPPDPRSIRPELDEPLAALVLRCLARDPAQRYGSAAELGEALAQAETRLVQGGGSLATPVRPSGPQDGLQRLLGQLAPTPSPRERSLAVLPVLNQGREEDEFLADSLTEDLIDSLSMAGLRVRSRGAVIGLKGSRPDPRDLGRRLGVQVVLEGTLRRHGELLRVSTRLVTVDDGFVLWARRFDRSQTDYWAIGEEAAAAIVEALAVGQERRAVRRDGPQDPAVLELYLRARQLMNLFTAEATDAALLLYEAALARAPDDPFVLSGFALACARRRAFGVSASAGDDHERALRAAERALALGPDLPEPCVAMAAVLFQEDALGTVPHLKRALERHPHHAEAHDLLGRLLVEVGPLDDAVRVLELALALEPALVRTRLDLARAHMLRGDRAACERTLATVTDTEIFGFLASRARLAIWCEDADSLHHYVDRILRLGTQQAEYFGRAVEGLEEGGQLLDQLAEMLPSPRTRVFLSQVSAEFAGWRRQPERAMASLERAVRAGLHDICWMERCPSLTPLRELPRFQELLVEVNKRAAPIVAALRG